MISINKLPQNYMLTERWSGKKSQSALINKRQAYNCVKPICQFKISLRLQGTLKFKQDNAKKGLHLESIKK